MEPSLELEFSRFAGEMAESLSFNKSIGQIYGLLFLCKEPLSLDEIAQRLKMSKGNASINLRILESWGAVRLSSMSGSRRDHYEANQNLKEIAIRRIEEGVGRRLSRAEDYLERLQSHLSDSNASSLDPHMKKKLEEVRSLVGKTKKAFTVLPKALKFL